MLAALLSQILLPFISFSLALPTPAQESVVMHTTYMNVPVTIEMQDPHAHVSVLGHTIIENNFNALNGPCGEAGDGYSYTVDGGLYTLCNMTVEVEGETLTGVIGDLRIPMN